MDLDNANANYREADQSLLQEKLWPLIMNDHLCHDQWRHSKVVGQPTYQEGDHVRPEHAYDVGLINYIERDVYRILPEIYPEGQDSRPFPNNLPTDKKCNVEDIRFLQGQQDVINIITATYKESLNDVYDVSTS